MYHFVGSPVSLLTYGPVPIRSYGSSLCLLPFVCSSRGLKVFYTIPLLTARRSCFVSLPAMTTWFDLSMTTTLLLIAWCPILIPLCYWFMDKKHGRLQSAGAEYLPLDLASQEQAPSLTSKRKMQLIWCNMPLALAMFAGVCARYLLVQAAVTTLIFPGLSVKARNHYMYYALSLALGESVGKFYGVIVVFLNCNLPRYTKHTWVFSSLMVPVF